MYIVTLASISDDAEKYFIIEPTIILQLPLEIPTG